MKNLRHLVMDGLENARDLGGYATNDGGMTKYGVFLRTELPENLSERDLALLKEYHVTLSIDLRGSRETVEEPSDLSKVEWIRYINLPMFNTLAAAGSESEKKKERPKDFKMPDWDVTYIRMLEEHKDWPGPLLKALAQAEGCAQFNCFTGKDRTGLCTAMLFSIAGVSKEDICADYTISMAYLNRRYAAMAAGFPVFPTDEEGHPSLSGGFFATLPTYMQKTLDYLERQYGGMLPYLKACSVTEKTMEMIRDKFVEY